MSRCLNIVLICISLIMNDFAVFSSLPWKCLLRSSVQLVIELFVFLVLSCVNCLYILMINPLLVISLAIIFHNFEGCIFILFIDSFRVQRLLSLIRSHFLFNFFKISITLVGGSQMILLCFMSRCVLLKFSSKSFSFFTCSYPVSQHHLLTRLSFLHCIFLPLCQR